ncbi:hypothetical protein [Streptomyces sp. NBC_01751]|uniref:hypothetical protein n=1 Tax=Streptomyces sp. NBC_01751 TaxID=2975929 RepID=UPI002DDACB4B|nr:hypothetical protein [Streptomyces sp. NBC_01751]WSD28959.1 hypothetical protein OHA26_39040 [Streptomyces sp. NBC_01751]
MSATIGATRTDAEFGSAAVVGDFNHIVGGDVFVAGVGAASSACGTGAAAPLAVPVATGTASLVNSEDALAGDPFLPDGPQDMGVTLSRHTHRLPVAVRGTPSRSVLPGPRT